MSAEIGRATQEDETDHMPIMPDNERSGDFESILRRISERQSSEHQSSTPILDAIAKTAQMGTDGQSPKA